MQRPLYVPILKWKQGEQGALRELDSSTKAAILPLLELPPLEYNFVDDCFKKTLEEHVEKLPQILLKSWAGQFYLDICNLQEKYLPGNIYIYSHIDELLETEDAISQYIPIYTPTCPLKNNSYFRHCIDSGRTIAIRLKFNEVDDFEDIMELVINNLNIIPEEMHNIDLIVDLGYINPSDAKRMLKLLKLSLSELPHINLWRYIIIAGTSMPETLSALSSGSSLHIPRVFYQLYTHFVSKHNYEREFIFGDYGISNPAILEDVDPRFLNPSCNIRYTIADSYFIVKGTAFKKYGGAQHADLCDKIISTPGIYYGSTFSAGDKYISDCATLSVSGGSLTTWRKAGTNHHLTLVVNQLSSLV